MCGQIEIYCRLFVLQKVTGNPLKYTALVGKPSEITYRYAEHVITKQARKMGYDSTMLKLYFVGYVHSLLPSMFISWANRTPNVDLNIIFKYGI